MATASIISLAITLCIIYLPISPIFDFIPLTGEPLWLLVMVTIGYIAVTEIVKIAYFSNLLKPRRFLSIPLRVVERSR